MTGIQIASYVIEFLSGVGFGLTLRGMLLRRRVREKVEETKKALQ